MPHVRVILVASLSLFALACGESRGGSVETVPTSTCASGSRWTGGDQESPLMRPGSDCIACHLREREGPQFTLAGTVYSDFTQADDCFGVAGVTVQVTDAKSVVTELVTNAAGNFYTEKPIATPYKVKLLLEGRERPMAAAQMSGACHSCHTAQGASGAPGRIVAP